MFGTSLRTAFLTILVAAGWACSGVSEEARQQSAESVEHGLGYLRECDAQGRCNVSAAIVAWERAIRLNPDNADAHRYLGTQFGSEGRFERAETHLRRAVHLYERQSAEDERLRALLAESRVTLGVVLVNLGRADEAIPLFRAAIEEITYTSQHLAWGNLGWALLRKGRFQEAAEALQRAVAIQPNFCVGYARLGEALYRLNEYGRALEALDRALGTEQPGCDRLQGAWLDRARVRVQLHQPERAREDLQRCIALDATTPEGRACAELGRSVMP
jgi:tetratricopeptide (TPR) repeat protein